MLRWIFVAAAVSGLLGVGQAKRSLPASKTGERKMGIQRVMRQVQRGRFAAAEMTARKILMTNPNAVGIQALLGVALVRRGRNADGLDYLDRTVGVMAYSESGGIAAHADALRAAGRGQDAWEVRKERLLRDLSDRERIQIYTQGVDDYLSIGRPDAALELGWFALSIDPDAPAPHAFLATAYLMAGDHESAGFHHWMSMMNMDVRSPRAAVNEAWLGEADHDLVGGLLAWERVRGLRKTKARIAGWHGGWLRRNDRMAEAHGVVYDPSWSGHQDPDLYAERVRISHVRGDQGRASDALGQLMAFFPGHPYIVDLEQLLSD